MNTAAEPNRWLREVAEHYCRLDLDPAVLERGFAAELTGNEFGDLHVGFIRAAPHRVWRSRELIEADQSSNYLLCLVSRGTAGCAQAKRATALSSGSFALLDTSQPFHYEAASEFEQVTVLVPRTQMEHRLPIRVLAELTGRAVDARQGSGRLVSGLLRDLAGDTSALTGSAAPALSSSVLDMVVTALIDGHGAVDQRDLHQARELRQAQDVLRRHMSDPEYSLADAAKDLGVSLRKLQNIFSVQGMTPSAWLQGTRLEKARNELLTTSLPLAELSERVGFGDVSHFSRSFRQRYGASPGQYRATHTRD